MKTVLVTGGSSGIGEAVVRLFSERGFNVSFSYRSNKDGADRLRDEIEGRGLKYQSFEANLHLQEDCVKLVSETIAHFGSIDVVVNNAGEYIDGDEWDGEYSAWESTFRSNVLSLMSVSKEAITHFQQKSSGVIVNIASRHGLIGRPYEYAYAASKAGVISVTQAQAELLAPFGRANSVCPGAVNAGYWSRAPKEELEEEKQKVPLRRLIEPEEIAHTVFFLASNDASGITGSNIVVDGGYGVRS